MKWLGRTAGATTCLLVVLAPPLATSEHAEAGLGSLYADCWFSRQSGKLTVKTKNSEEATLRRRGKRIAVLAPAPTRCKGGRATIRNTSRIRFVLRGSGITEGHLSLSGGPFSPGAAPEADGTPEVEFHVVVPNGDSTFYLDGSPGPDHLRGGTVAGLPGVNLNPAAEQLMPDADLTVGGRFGDLIWFATKGGDDILELTGGPEFQAPMPFAIAELGAGNDQFFGSVGSELVFAGPGLDVVSTGAGEDAVNTEDGVAETVDCGEGKDLVQPDSDDVLVSCEEITFVGFAD